MPHQSPDEAGRPVARNLNLPNLITIARALLVPVVIWLLAEERFQAAFIVFVLAGISDALDGLLAKWLNQRTELGAYLDPLADKLLITGIFVVLGVLGELPSWLVMAVVGRDVLIVSAVLVSALLARPVHIRPLIVSKVNTTLQIALAATVMADAAYALQLEIPRLGLIWTTAAFTLLSLAAYIREWLAHMAAGPPAAGQA